MNLIKQILTRQNIKVIIPFNIIRTKFERDLSFTTIGVAIGGLFNVLINLIIINLYSVADFGIYAIAFSVFMLVQFLTTAGVDQSVTKHCSEIKNKDKAWHEIIVSGLALVGVTCVVGMGVSLVLGPLISNLVFRETNPFPLLYYLLPALPLASANKLLTGVLNASRRMGVYGFIQAVRPMFYSLGLYACAELGYPLKIAVATFFATEFLLFFILLLANRRYLFHAKGVNHNWIRKHIAFGRYELTNQVFSELNLKVDYFILGMFASPAVVGSFAFAADLIKNSTLPAIIVQINFNPIISGLWGANNTTELNQKALAIMKSTYWGYLVLLTLGAILYPILTYMFVSNVFSAQNVICFYILSLGIFIWSGPIAILGLLSFTRLVRWQAKRAMLTFGINLVMSFIFIPWLEAVGAAISTMGSFLFSTMLVWYVVDKQFGLDLRPWRLPGKAQTL